MSVERPRVVIAGQIPPPYGGQNIMIQKALAQFAASPECESIHLPFYFTPEVGKARGASLAKLFELICVIKRLLAIRLRGPIDLLLYPTGGPQTVPILRDILLLPWMLMFSKRLVLHFHAGGVADRFAGKPRHPLALCLRALYGRAYAAVVMTEFNRRDPAFSGIKKILVIPHRIEDEFDPLLLRRNGMPAPRFLYIGHLCADKGTLQLLRAFAAITPSCPGARLELVGECLPPFSHSELESLLQCLAIESKVCVMGVLAERERAQAYARADFFIFPSIAPYESFGLVLIEAMMWGLPVAATRWRGNSEVLTAEIGGILFPAASPLEIEIEAALRESLKHLWEWKDWGKRNRALFEGHYKEAKNPQWLTHPILTLLAQNSR